MSEELLKNLASNKKIISDSSEIAHAAAMHIFETAEKLMREKGIDRISFSPVNFCGEDFHSAYVAAAIMDESFTIEEQGDNDLVISDLDTNDAILVADSLAAALARKLSR